MSATTPLHHIEEYERYVGGTTIERIRAKARQLEGLRVAHVNSTFYGGGVAELLSSLTLLMASAGLKTGWRAIHGPPEFFSVTKRMHNALQSGDLNLTEQKRQIYEGVVAENAIRNHIDHDFVIVHDPQPLPLIRHYRKRGPWIWRCHIDLTQPHPELWKYLAGFVDDYDAVIVTLEEYAQRLRAPQLFFMPAIDPFTSKNREFSQEEIDERLEHYEVPTDLPLVAQVSRFDRWKDPEGVIRAFKLASREIDARLVLLGNVATDDPEGEEVYKCLQDEANDRIRILSVQDSAFVNALQRRAHVVLQKSLREGFGLTVTEAMWKGAAVIGGNVGGIRYQIENGVNGFLVSGVEETAQRIVQLVQDPKLRHEMGKRAHESVRERFLMTRLLEQYLDMFLAFRPSFQLGPLPQRARGSRLWEGDV